MIWVTVVVMSLCALALAAVTMEWFAVGVTTVAVTAYRSAKNHFDPASPRNLERSLTREDARELKAQLAALYEASFQDADRW